MSLRKITGKNIQAALDDQPPVTARNLLSALHSLFQAPACSNRDRRSPTSAPPPAGRACRRGRHARTYASALAIQRHNDHFGTQPKRSS